MKLCIVFQTAVALYLALSPAQSLPLVEINNTTEEKMRVVFQQSSSNRVVEAGTATYVLFQQRAGQIIMQLLLMFQQVWGRSFCRTIEKLVEVVQEYPTEVEHIYSPSCVPLVRCAGCCGDENLECHPTQTTNVTMQLLKIRPSEPDQEYVEMMFVEHQTCECRVRKPIVKVERRRQRGRGRKRKERQKTRDCDRCPPRR